MAMITADDFTFLRRAIDIATTAITTGDDPYGSLLAGPPGKILIEAHNTVRRDNDITAHPELKLASAGVSFSDQWAASPCWAFYLRRCHARTHRKHTLHRATADARPTSRPTASRPGPQGSVTVSDGGCPRRTRAEPS
jgi:hypothetical protein